MIPITCPSVCLCTYLKDVCGIHDDVEHVERGPTDEEERRDGYEHPIGPSDFPQIRLVVLPNHPVLLQIPVDEGVADGHGHEGNDVLDEEGENGVNVPLALR